MNIAGKTALTITLVIFTMVASLATFTPPVFAQGHKGSAPSGPPPSPEERMKKSKREEEEKAAKAAMDRIPDSKTKYDPWKIER